jgi:hypothetical protein
MSNRRASPLPASLSKAHRRFEQWRNRNKPRTRLPAELWSSAVELAREHGVNRTAKALRLDYYSLKKRLAGVGEEGDPSPEFIEILPEMSSAPAAGCTMEIDDETGATLRLRVHGAEFPDLAAITRAFRGDAS